MVVRVDVYAHPDDPAAVCFGEPDGHAVHGVDAGVCRPGAAWRPAYAGVFDGGGGRGRAGFGVFTGAAPVGARTDEDDSDFRRNFWGEPGAVRIFAMGMAVAGAAAVYRIRDAAGRDGEQHHHPDADPGRETGTRDELLHRGICGDGAVREPVCGRHGTLDWRAADGDGHGIVLHPRRGVVLVETASDPQRDAADLRAA